jgi:hypothetical protein
MMPSAPKVFIFVMSASPLTAAGFLGKQLTGLSVLKVWASPADVQQLFVEEQRMDDFAGKS